MAIRVSTPIALVASSVAVLTGLITIYQFIVPIFSCPRFDLTGHWTLITRVTNVDLQEHVDEMGKTNTFSVTFEQICNNIDGRATKTLYDAKTVHGPLRSHLEISTLRIDGNEVHLKFLETWQGTQAESNGTFILNVASGGNSMSGKFTTAIGSIQGTVSAKRD